MLGTEHARRQRVGRVIGEDRYCRLRDDRPGIHGGAHEMHRAAVDHHPGLERADMGAEALKGGQDGGMDVDHPVAPAVNERLREKTHEARETDDIDFRLAQDAVDFRLEGRPVTNRFCVDDSSCDTRLGGASDAGRVGTARKHQHYFRGIVGHLRSADKRRHVGAAAGDEDGDAFAIRHGRSRSSFPS